MTTRNLTDEKQEDIIERVRRFIDEGREDDAVELIQSVDDIEQMRIVSVIDDHYQYELIYDLARAYNKSLLLHTTIIYIRARVRAYTRDLAYALAFARDLDIAYAHAIARAVARDLDIAYAHAIARAVARDLDIARALALAFARDLDIARALARDLARDLDRSLTSDLAGDFSLNLARASGILEIVTSYLIVQITDFIRELSEQDEPTVLSRVIQRVLEAQYAKLALPVRFEGVESITADVLEREFMPMFRALRDMQELWCEWHEIEFIEPTIEKMEPGSIVTRLKNMFEASRYLVNAELKREVEELRLENSRLKHALEVKDKEYERKLAEQALAYRESRVQEIEVLETERSRLESQLQSVLNNMKKEYLEMAREFIDVDAPHLSPEDKLEHTLRLATVLRQWFETNLDMKLAIKILKPKPKNLPYTPKDKQDD